MAPSTTPSVVSAAAAHLPAVAVSSVPGIADATVLADRDKALEVFMGRYPKARALANNKESLQSMYATAKGLGDDVNGARGRINHLKSSIEARRVERRLGAVVEGKMGEEVAELPPDAEEESMVAELDACKKSYHSGFQKLRELKKEVGCVVFGGEGAVAFSPSPPWWCVLPCHRLSACSVCTKRGKCGRWRTLKRGTPSVWRRQPAAQQHLHRRRRQRLPISTC